MTRFAAWSAGSLALVSFLTGGQVRADTVPNAAALLQKVTDIYKNAPTFSCEGHYENDLQAANPIKLLGTFRILYARPDEIRVDWTDTLMGGEVITSSVFTQDKTFFFLFGQLHKWSPQKDMETALGTAAGISHGISYAIPSLLRGQRGYLTFTSWKPVTHAAINGHDCLVLAGATKFQGDMQIAIDPSTYTILQTKSTQVIRHADIQKEIDRAKKAALKSDPALAGKLHDAPASPDFTAIDVTTYENPIFGKALTPADFVYPVPADAKKVDNVLK